MKVGDKVWLFDMNRRVYQKDGAKYSSPIYSEYFYETVIGGETSRSWIVDFKKYPKKFRGDHCGIYTSKQKDDAIWEHNNRRKIMEKVQQCTIEKLKEIDALLK